MRDNPRSLLLRYGGALLAVAMAAAARVLLSPVFGEGFPFPTFFIAVVFVAYYAGLGPAVLALLLGSLTAVYFFIPPGHSLALHRLDDVIGLGLFLLVSSVTVLLSEALHAARRRLEARVRQAVESQELLRVALASAGDAVLVTDSQGNVHILNPVAQFLTGWTATEAVGQPLKKVFQIRNEETGAPADFPARRVLEEGIVIGLGNHTLLIARDGTSRPVDDSAAPIRSEDGTIFGMVLIFRDVSDRRQLERLQRDYQNELEQQVQERTAQLRASEERFRLLVEGTHDYAIFMLDPGGHIVSWNPGAERIKGYRADEIIGRHFDAFYPPEDVERGKPAYELEVATTLGKYEEEGWRLRKDGSRFWASVLITALRDESQALRGFSKITRDLTELKAAEDAARNLRAEQAARRFAEEAERQSRAQAEQLGLFVEHLPAAVAMFDRDMRYLYVSRRWRADYELGEQDLVGRSHYEIFPEIPERWKEVHRHCLAGAVQRSEEDRFDRPGGVARWLRWECRPWRDAGGEIGGILIFSEDITERKQGEAQLRFLADASKTLAELTDPTSALQKVAALAVPFFADWCAVDMAEANGTLRRLAVAHVDPSKVELAHELQRRYPPDPKAPGGAYHILRTGQAVILSDITDDFLVQTIPDPELRRIVRELGLRSYIGVPLQARGKTLGVITFIAAESGRRYKARDLAVAQELAHRAGIAVENAQLYAELREADRLKDEFLAMLAHELRNPLAPIRNALHVIKQVTSDGVLVGQMRDVAERQVLHMARLLDDLLDVSRISRGKIELRSEVVDLAAVVRQTAEVVRPMIEERRHDLTLNLAPEPVYVRGDPTRLEQILTNLLNNAAKYTDPGGRITVTVACPEGRAVLRVRDSGIGIAPEMLPRIFELFVQAERRLDRSQGGVGIGLTLVRRLVELHGGTVEASSAGLGQGSEFVVALPALARGPSTAPTAPPDEDAPMTTKHRRILVVDDNVDSAESLGMLLRLAGQEVQVAYNGQSALALAGTFRPHVVLMDIGMPGMDGYETARRLRQQPGLEKTMLVALTGWGQEEDRRRSLEAGFDRHLVKPIEPEQLTELLASCPS
jgi:PAS domain S-box-containing protein